jgi:hypothetical protein
LVETARLKKSCHLDGADAVPLLDLDEKLERVAPENIFADARLIASV